MKYLRKYHARLQCGGLEMKVWTGRIALILEAHIYFFGGQILVARIITHGRTLRL